MNPVKLRIWEDIETPLGERFPLPHLLPKPSKIGAFSSETIRGTTKGFLQFDPAL